MRPKSFVIVGILVFLVGVFVTLWPIFNRGKPDLWGLLVALVGLVMCYLASRRSPR